MTTMPVNAMTVDVEDYYHVSAFADTIEPAAWDTQEPRVAQNTSRLLEIFDDAGIRATFFVLGWVAERHPEIVHEIHRCGHEIACHGYSHKLVFNQEPREFRSETLRAKCLLEDTIAESVLGYRAASYSITRQSLWALDILVEAGFLYDSSIFPIRHDRYGIPNSDRWPHELETIGGSKLIEFPLSTAKVAGVRVPIAGGGYFRLYPYWFTRFGLGRVNGDGHPFVFYLHPWEIDPQQPRVNASMLSRIRHYRNIDRVEDRLRQLLSDFTFAPCAEVLKEIGFLEVGAGHRPAAVSTLDAVPNEPNDH